MKKYSSLIEERSRRHFLLIACAAALAVAFAVALLQPAHADVTPPPAPTEVQVPPGNKLFLVGHAVGTQNYVCLPSGDGVRFILFTPQATLFKDNEKQIMTHFFSPNPDENGVIRPTWQDSKDTSRVWARVEPGNSSADPAFVQPGAIAWLLLTVVGAEEGPKGGDRLTQTTFIQRLNTSGGVAPSTGCASSADIGNTAFVPYEADYFFYRAAGGKEDKDGQDF